MSLLKMVTIYWRFRRWLAHLNEVFLFKVYTFWDIMLLHTSNCPAVQCKRHFDMDWKNQSFVQLALLQCWLYYGVWSFPGGSDSESVCLQCGRPRFDPWVVKIPWRRKWQPTPVLLPGKFHGWRSLVGYSPRGRKQSDTTERLHFHFTFNSLG